MTAADLNRARDAGDATEASKPKRKRRPTADEFFGTEFVGPDEEMYQDERGIWRAPPIPAWTKRKRLEHEDRYVPWRIPQNLSSLMDGVPYAWPQGPHVYFLAHLPRRMVKIGFSTNLYWRLAGIATSSPVRLRLLAWRYAPRGRSHEKALHIRWQDYRVYGEWFHCCGDLREWILEHIDGRKRPHIAKALDAGVDCDEGGPAA